MIHFKNHNNQGFSFIEIVLAVAIIGLILTAVFNLQNNVFRLAIMQHSKILRIFDIKNVFFDYEINETLLKGQEVKKKFTDPNMDLSAQLIQPHKDSMLSKFDNIYLIRSTGKWTALSRDNELSMVCVLFHVKKEKKQQ